MIEPWKIWSDEAASDGPTYPDRCVWETQTERPFHFVECGRPLPATAEFFCVLHDADAADAGIIDPDDFDAQERHHRALAEDPHYL